METHEIPSFTLTDARGQPVGTANLLQRREMLVAVVHRSGCAPCRKLLEQLSERIDSGELDAALVAVSLGEPETAGQHAPVYPVAADDGRVAQAIWKAMGARAEEPLLVISDRYGSAYAARPIHGQDVAELVAESQEWVDYIQMQCPE